MRLDRRFPIAKALSTVAVLAAIFLCGRTHAFAAPPLELREKLRKANDVVTHATTLYKAKKFKEAADALGDVGKTLAELSADKQMTKAVEPVWVRLQTLHDDLELQGVKVAELPKLDAAEPATPAGKTPAGKPVAGKTPAAAGGASFVKDIAPMIVARCSRCHIEKAQGALDMGTYAALMKGSKDGVVVMSGKGASSRIVEVIESGDMPRGGGKVTPAELASLTKWIDAGAKFDGPDEKVQLAKLVPAGTKAAPAMNEPKLQVSRATGSETISFSRDIAPILATNCVGCHGAMQPRARLDMDNFAGLLRGSENGLVLTPGKAADSLLVKKIKGTAGDRMPLKKPPLSDDATAKIEKWIAEGAKFDGNDAAKQSMENLAAVYIAAHATHEELMASRSELAQRTWKLGIPDDKSDKVESKNFLVIGNVGEEMLKQVSETAEQQVPNISRILHAPADAPLIRGRMTLFVFNKKFDYAEFSKMVEQRDASADSRGHWKYTVIDAYGAIIPQQTKDAPITGLVVQQVAATYVASLGRMPDWFADGVGRVVAARLDSKDPRIKQWDEQVTDILAANKPDAFMNGNLSGEEAGVASYSYVKFLMGVSAPKFGSLMNGLRQGDDFDRAFIKAFGGAPQQALPAWVTQVARHPAPKKSK